MNILIVDDSKATLEIIRRALLKFDYRRLEIKKYDSPIQALRLLTTWRPDIILTDWHMPEMSGLEFIVEARRQKVDATIGMITTVDDEVQIRQAKQAGAAFVLSKPFDDDELHRNLLRVAQEAEASQVLPNQAATKHSDGIALPKLPQLEKLLKKVVSDSMTVQKIQPQKFDVSKLPCLLAVYADAENQRTRAIAVLDIYALCVFASSSKSLTEPDLRTAMMTHKVDEKMVEACKKLLETTSLSFLDRHSRFSLKLKTINVFYERFDKLESLFNVGPERRIDFSCQVDNLAQGRITMVGM